jgi:hypothetical protein
MSSLNEFFKQEQKRVYEPDPYFSHRVIARLKEQSVSESSLWDTIVASTRPVLALALTIVFALIAIHLWVPVEPARGMIESYFSSEVSAGESFLYSDSETPPSHDMLEQLMLLENGQ